MAQEETVRQFEAGIGFSSNTYSVLSSHEHHQPQNPLCYETLGRTALHISQLYILARRTNLQIGILETVGVSDCAANTSAKYLNHNQDHFHIRGL
jgi:hypothetical protein